MNKLPSNTPDIEQYKQEVTLYLSVTQEIKGNVKKVTDKLDRISLGQLDQQMEEGVKYRSVGNVNAIFSYILKLIFS